MASSNSNAGEAQSKFENVLTCPFFVDTSNSYRIQVTLINGKPYVGFCKYFRSGKDGEFYPGRAPFLMPFQAWKSLLPRFTGIAKRVSALGLSVINSFHL